MSMMKKSAVAALFVAVMSLVAAPEAKANPFEKLIGGAARKTVGGISKSIGKNVTQSSRLILRAAPYALLQGSASRGSRMNAPSGNQGATFGTTGQMIQNSVIRNGINRTNNVMPRTNGTFRRPIYFRSRR